MRRLCLLLASFTLLVTLFSAAFVGTASAQTQHNLHATIPACNYNRLDTGSIYDDSGHYQGYAILWQYSCGLQVHTQTFSAIGNTTVESIAASTYGYQDQQCSNCTMENSHVVNYAPGHTVGYGYVNGWGVEI